MGCRVFQMGIFFDAAGNARNDSAICSTVATRYETLDKLYKELDMHRIYHNSATIDLL